MNNDQKYKAISLLQLDKSPREVAEELDLSYASILRFKRQWEEAKLEGEVDKLLELDKAVLHDLAMSVDGQVAKDAAVELVAGVTSLERLSQDVHKTASTLITRTNSLMMSCNTLDELNVAADILCNIQKAFFNTNSTQVNIQNNLGDSNESKRYTQYLSDTPAA